MIQDITITELAATMEPILDEHTELHEDVLVGFNEVFNPTTQQTTLEAVVGDLGNVPLCCFVRWKTGCFEIKTCKPKDKS